MLKRLLISMMCMWATACIASAKPTWVTQEFQGGVCKDIETGDVDKGEDYIIRQCESFPGISTWVIFNEGVRLSLGFGKMPNTSLGPVNTIRGDWPIEWGGENENGKFVPQVTIGRFSGYGDEPPHPRLFVFRILSNGMSCVVGDFATNVEAKAAATAAIENWICESKATPIEFSTN